MVKYHCAVILTLDKAAQPAQLRPTETDGEHRMRHRIIGNAEQLGLGGITDDLQHLDIVTFGPIRSLVVILEVHQIHIIILRKVVEHYHGVFSPAAALLGT